MLSVGFSALGTVSPPRSIVLVSISSVAIHMSSTVVKPLLLFIYLRILTSNKYLSVENIPQNF